MVKSGITIETLKSMLLIIYYKQSLNLKTVFFDLAARRSVNKDYNLVLREGITFLIDVGLIYKTERQTAKRNKSHYYLTLKGIEYCNKILKIASVEKNKEFI